MIPQVRRALDPGVALASAASGYTDDMLAAIIADASCELLMIGGSDAFPFTTTVASASVYGYPSEWLIDPAPPMEIQALIATQAALGQVFNELRGLKTRERISNEGATWEYEKSSTILRDKVALLRYQRDKALELASRVVPSLDVLVDLMAYRAPTISTDVGTIQ